MVTDPMDIGTIMEKMRGHLYPDKNAFKADVMLIFDNCRLFNEAGTEIVRCADSLTFEFA